MTESMENAGLATIGSSLPQATEDAKALASACPDAYAEMPVFPKLWYTVAVDAIEKNGVGFASSSDAKLRLFDVISLMEGLMPRKFVCVALVAVFALPASRSTHAQVTVDVTKVNCDQFVHHKISEPRLIAAWLSGYYNAKRNNRVIDLQALEENMSKVTNYCSDEKNFKVPVMKAVEQVLGKGN